MSSLCGDFLVDHWIS